MKKTLTTIITLFVFGTSAIAQPGDAVNRVKANMAGERTNLLEDTVNGWLEQKTDAEMRKTITRLMDVHVRLQALDDKATDGLVGRVLTHVDAEEISTVSELASAIAHSYYREKGLVVDTRECFASVYYIWPEGKKE